MFGATCVNGWTSGHKHTFILHPHPHPRYIYIYIYTNILKLLTNVDLTFEWVFRLLLIHPQRYGPFRCRRSNLGHFRPASCPSSLGWALRPISKTKRLSDVLKSETLPRDRAYKKRRQRGFAAYTGCPDDGRYNNLCLKRTAAVHMKMENGRLTTCPDTHLRSRPQQVYT